MPTSTEVEAAVPALSMIDPAVPAAPGALAALVLSPGCTVAGGQTWSPDDEAVTPIGYELALALGDHGRPADTDTASS